MPLIKNKDGDLSNTDRFAAGPGEMFVYDDETGLREMIGDVPEAAIRRRSRLPANDAWSESDHPRDDDGAFSRSGSAYKVRTASGREVHVWADSIDDAWGRAESAGHKVNSVRIDSGYTGPETA